MKKFFIPAMVAALAIATASSAYARCSSGEIANLLCEGGVINQRAANRIDDFHAGAGNPLDRAADEAARQTQNHIERSLGGFIR